MEARAYFTLLVWTFTINHEALSVVVPNNVVNGVCMTSKCKEVAKSILRDMDQSVSPCTDFYGFVCGGWIKRTEIPEGATFISRLSEAARMVEDNMKKILEKHMESQQEKVLNLMATAYKVCKDTDVLPRKDLDDFKKAFANKGFTDWPQKKSEKLPMTTRNIIKRYGWFGLFGIDVSVNVFQVTRHAIVMSLPVFEPLSLELLEDLEGAEIQDYKTFIVQVITKIKTTLSNKEAQEIADSIYDFEIEQVQASRYPSSDVGETTVSKIDEVLKSDLKLKEAITYQFRNKKVSLRGEDGIIVWTPGYYTSIFESIEENGAVDLYNLLGWKSACLLMKYSRGDLFEMYTGLMKTVDPLYNQRPIENVCVSDLMKNMKYAFGSIYVDRYFRSEEIKTEVREISDKVKASIEKMIKKKSWIDATTQAEALKKVLYMHSMVGYPNWVRDKVKVEQLFKHVKSFNLKMSYIEISMLLISNNLRVNYEKIKLPVQSDEEWDRDFADVNGQYKPQTNSFALYAGLIQEPLYIQGAPIAVNVGSVGWFSGHELTHAFDTIGSRYDSTGRYRDWWSEAVRSSFEVQADCFRDQYSKIYDREAKEHLRGVRTKVENIADNGGIRAAVKALKAIIKETPAADVKLPGLEQHSSRQLLFISFGNSLCSKYTTRARKQYIKVNSHSLPEFRVNVSLQNCNAFQKAFRCMPGSPMAPKNKCILW
ncbi:neprilysin-1-like [Ixodes scapularis]|uniref:neprilysin-1-like n=1 Tax=Ixodes scapularis TaxID=6945 RepID=UPI001A9E6F60|nr:neprilysin-1-like [Ixodes scapularis]